MGQGLEAVAPGRDPVTKFFYTKAIKEKERKVSAVISARSVDRDGDVILPEAFEARLETYRKNPVVTFAHNIWAPPVGKADNFEITEEEFSADIEFADTEEGEKLWKLYKGGFMNAFSAGFIPIAISKEPVLPGQSGLTFTEVELVETACVPVPSNRDALQRAFGGWADVAKSFDFLKSLDFMDIVQDKGVIPYQDLTLDSDSSWDASGARSRLRAWASSDGSGDKDTVDWAKYRKGFCATREDGDSEDFGTYMLPLADIKGGTLTAVFKGVQAVMGALNGSRGGVKLTDDERRRVYNAHVRRYYKKAGKEDELPELRSFSSVAEELAKLQAGLIEIRRAL